jgi:hypothetical protein
MNPPPDPRGLEELGQLWKQEPIQPPRRDLELTPDSWVERGGEVVGWWIARLEYWVSASGWLRAWLRLNLILAIILSIAGFLLLPAVSQVLEELAKTSHSITAVLDDVFGVVRSLPPVLVSLGIAYLAVVILRRWLPWRRGRPSRGYPGEDYYQ